MPSPADQPARDEVEEHVDQLRAATDPMFALGQLVEAVQEERAARKVGGDRLRRAAACVTELLERLGPAPDHEWPDGHDEPENPA